MEPVDLCNSVTCKNDGQLVKPMVKPMVKPYETNKHRGF